MAIGTTTVTAAELTNKGLDKPLVCGRNLMRLARAAGTNMLWNHAGGTPTMISTDYSDTTGPASLMGDDGIAVQSFTTNTSATSWILVDFGSTYTVDFIAFLNTNFKTRAGSLYVELDDTSNFAAPVTVLSAVSFNNDERSIFLSLGAGNARYTGVRYMRIKIIFSGASIPYCGEIYVGQRVQLYHRALDPYDIRSTVGAVDIFETLSGHRVTYQRWAGRRVFAPVFEEPDTTGQANLRTFYDQANGGGQAILWVDKPDSAPQTFMLLNQPSQGRNETAISATVRRFEFNAFEEIGPPFEVND